MNTYESRKKGIIKRKVKQWSASEVEVLKEHYPTKGAEYVGELLGRNVISVRHKAQRVGMMVTQQ